MDLHAYLATRKLLVEDALDCYLQHAHLMPPRLVEAMRYSLLAGGKRLRPVLVFAGAEAMGATAESVMPCACALEMIHTFSLVHDDLPAMDDDDLRRGVPTNHKQFDEATAILAGDGLLAEAFWCLSDPQLLAGNPGLALTVLRDIAAATGGRGMVGGQLYDIAGEHQTLSQAEVDRLHLYKTGALIRVAVVSGAKLAGASAAQCEQLAVYGDCIGLAFQIADDLLAIESSAETLGKPVGNDEAREKATYPAMMGKDAARARMIALTAEAVEAVASFGTAADPLRAIAQYVTTRTH